MIFLVQADDRADIVKQESAPMEVKCLPSKILLALYVCLPAMLVGSHCKSLAWTLRLKVYMKL